jgi:hypothetical protein
MHRRTVKTPAYIAGLRLTWLWLVLGCAFEPLPESTLKPPAAPPNRAKHPTVSQIISTLLTLRKAQNPTLVSMRTLLCEVRHDD